MADVYTMEPYVYAQFITGKEHPDHFGRARNSWLTGTAAWSFVAVSQYILGIRAGIRRFGDRSGYPAGLVWLRSDTPFSWEKLYDQSDQPPPG